ncbi:MAG: molecular chaperone DnaJ [Chloroflexi bacterium]|nr:molecular chaperone DnaJ [Chloroflexota bacterium]
MATKRDYYEVLGLPRNASEDDVRRAFRRLAMESHPDRNGDPGAAEQFKEINEAYRVLSDAEKRQTYDRYGHASVDGSFNGGFGAQTGFSGFGDFGFEDIFDTFFGRRTATGRRPRAERGADLRADLFIEFEEAVFGTKKDVEMPRHEPCGTCSGSGLQPGTQLEVCRRCGGNGEIRRTHQSLLGQFVNVSICDQCRGEGRVNRTPCGTCRGGGRVQVTKRLEVAVPAGIEDGTQIRLTGEGEPPETTRGGRAPGDLYLVVHVPSHTILPWEGNDLLVRRQGHDLVLDIPLNVAQASLGDEIQVPTLEGAVELKIPSGTQYGKSFRIKGKGVPHLGEKRRGDLQVRVHIMVPTELNREQRELFQKLDASFRKTANSDAKSLFEKVKEAFGV